MRHDLVPANIDDRDAAAEMLASGCGYRADKGFHGQECQREWRDSDGALVRAEPPHSARAAWPRTFAHLAHRLHHLIEAVNAQLEGQFGIERTLAKSLWGLVTRMQAKLTAYTAGEPVDLFRPLRPDQPRPRYIRSGRTPTRPHNQWARSGRSLAIASGRRVR